MIPQRYKSSRFLETNLDIDGTPMIIRVPIYNQSRSKRKHLYWNRRERIEVVDDYDYKVILTSDNCLTEQIEFVKSTRNW